MFLGIDIGTSGSKGVLTDAGGKVLTRSERPHEVSMPRPGVDVWAETYSLAAGMATSGAVTGCAAWSAEVSATWSRKRARFRRVAQDC